MNKQSGFTIVELLVVIVVIGILAAITVVSYTGISNKAIVATIKSDLIGAARNFKLYNVEYGTYPTDIAETSTGSGVWCASAPTPDSRYCLKSSGGNLKESYEGTQTSFRLVIKNGNNYLAISDGSGPVAVTPPNAGVVTTLAGSGTGAFADGTGTAASFFEPWAVAIDSSGNIYISDYLNNRVRKISPAGVVTTLASGVNGPRGLTVDSSGNVYVAEGNSHRILKISSAGVVATLAGSGTGTFADGTGIAASFKYPFGVAVDSSGNVYVADGHNHIIRKITSAGVVTTLAGSGTGTYADGQVQLQVLIIQVA